MSLSHICANTTKANLLDVDCVDKKKIKANNAWENSLCSWTMWDSKATYIALDLHSLFALALEVSWIQLKWSQIIGFSIRHFLGVGFFSHLRFERREMHSRCKCIRREWIDCFWFRQLATNHEKCQFHNLPFNMWLVGTVAHPHKKKTLFTRFENADLFVQ